MNETKHIHALSIDEASAAARQPEFEHDRKVAITDILEWNHFELLGHEGPYAVLVGTSENRVTYSITSEAMEKSVRLMVSMQPFKTLIRDYFMICENYKEAVQIGNLPRIEAIDMSRRGLHNEGAEMFKSKLATKIDMDFETARRLFTLISVLHVR